MLQYDSIVICDLVAVYAKIVLNKTISQDNFENTAGDQTGIKGGHDDW
ncbi:MAG: hypothetical protein VB113_08545 [Acetobacterium wieringae]|nr:hypothetical protein [Acetobacterium wieringae]